MLFINGISFFNLKFETENIYDMCKYIIFVFDFLFGTFGKM